ncbi:hypothetical protein PoB_004981000 [Plakobranchus ocellatus]|uniref:Uncharacterized protein n=1 Tax=Plakobranchus ocellatus TaxID=259542 RepID=A0AAV4BRZ6_9GAST|nr:hypothetical protein PoB_004981000 [Plakobranchus ocellatus]
MEQSRPKPIHPHTPVPLACMGSFTGRRHKVKELFGFRAPSRSTCWRGRHTAGTPRALVGLKDILGKLRVDAAERGLVLSERGCFSIGPLN